MAAAATVAPAPAAGAAVAARRVAAAAARPAARARAARRHRLVAPWRRRAVSLKLVPSSRMASKEPTAIPAVRSRPKYPQNFTVTRSLGPGWLISR